MGSPKKLMNGVLQMRNNKPLTPIKRHILWQVYRWKMLTTTQVHTLMDSDASLDYVTSCVRALTKDRYLCDAEVRSSRSYYRLRPKSLLEIDFKGKHPKENGLRSEHYAHDLIVNAFQVGDIPISKNRSHYEFVTERELRSIADPSEVIAAEAFKIRRPDGLTTLDGQDGYICIEVELSTKKKSRYEYSVPFYENKNIALVLWLVKEPSQIKLLQNIFGIAGKHNFILLNHFLENHWNAKILAGPQVGKSIAQVHCIQKNEDPERQDLPSLHNCFLDPIKRVLTDRQDLFRDPHESECYL